MPAEPTCSSVRLLIQVSPPSVSLMRARSGRLQKGSQCLGVTPLVVFLDTQSHSMSHDSRAHLQLCEVVDPGVAAQRVADEGS